MTTKIDVNQQAHYNTGTIEVFDFIIDHKLDFCDGNILKYITRATHKGQEINDREKALWYIIRSLIMVQGKKNTLVSVKKAMDYFNNRKFNK